MGDPSQALESIKNKIVASSPSSSPIHSLIQESIVETEARKGEDEQILLSSNKIRHVFIQMSQVSGSGSKLYGRQLERAQLVQCWERCRENKHQELVVISGTPGTGKSTLANALRPVVNIEKPMAFFLSGKFAESSHHRKRPFEIFATAFASYVDQLYDSGDKELIERCKRTVQEAVRPDAGTLKRWVPAFGKRLDVLVQMVPAFERLLDHEPPTSTDQTAGSTDSAAGSSHPQIYCSELSINLREIFCNAVAAICSCTPIALFLDDFQWADTSSLDVINSLMLWEQNVSLLVVTTLRSKAKQDSPQATIPQVPNLSSHSSNNKNSKETEKVYSTFRDWKHNETIHLTSIDLSELALAHVQLLLSDALNKDASQVLELARIALAQTQGNIFHLLQFIRLLVEQSIIKPKGDTWIWDGDASLISAVEALDDSAHSILDLVTQTIRSLPPQVQEALKVASCLGDDIDVSALDIVLQTAANPLLRQASEEGLLVFSSQYGGYRFAHDWIRHAAFSLIPQEQVSEFHLKIGRRLWRGVSAAVVEENITMIVSLLAIGSDRIEDQRERYKVAELNLRAAKKALLLPSFPDAARYLRQGLMFLGNDCWNESYQLSLNFYSLTSEIEVLNGRYDIVAPCIDQVVTHAITLDDKLQAYAALINSMRQQDDIQHAESLCVTILAELGENLPARATKFLVAKELLVVRYKLHGKSNDDLLALPPMKDHRKMQAIDFLVLGFLLGWKTRSPMCVLFALRAVSLSLRYGLHENSAIAFAYYAMALCGLHIDPTEAYRLGTLAQSIATKYKSAKIITMTNLIVGATVFHWSKPIAESLSVLEYTAVIGLETGFVEEGVSALYAWNTVAHGIGLSLATIQKNMKRVMRLARLHHNRIIITAGAILLQGIDCFDGTSSNPNRLSGTAIDFEEIACQIRAAHDKSLLAVLYGMAMEVAYVHGDLVEASRMLQLYLPCVIGAVSPMHTGGVSQAEVGLVAISSYRLGEKWARDLKVAKTYTRKVTTWVKDGAVSFTPWALLLQAELGSVTSGHRSMKVAINKLYDSAFSHAQSQDNLMCMALSREKWGDYLDMNGEREDAISHWREAAETYKKWGALIKSKMLLESISCV